MTDARSVRRFEEDIIAVRDVALNLLSRTSDDANSPILFLHGFPTFSGVWRGVMSELPDRFSCNAPDLLGFNRSAAPRDTARYTLAQGVTDIVALIEALWSGRRVVVVGHDVGGMLGYGLAAAHPDRVAGLVVINGVHATAYQHALLTDRAQAMAAQYLDLLCHPTAGAILSADDFGALKKSLRRTLWCGRGPDAWFDLEDQIVASWRRAGSFEGPLSWYRANRFDRADPEAMSGPRALPDTIGQVQRITVPHLLIWGTPDPFLNLVNARLVEDLCDEMRLITWHGAAHAPHLSRPLDVARELTEFADQVLSGEVGV